MSWSALPAVPAGDVLSAIRAGAGRAAVGFDAAAVPFDAPWCPFDGPPILPGISVDSLVAIPAGAALVGIPAGATLPAVFSS